MDYIERQKEITKAESSVQNNEYIQNNMQLQFDKIYDYLDNIKSNIDYLSNISTEHVAQLANLVNIANVGAGIVYFMDESYINNTINWGKTIKFGRSSFAEFHGDTYWLSIDVNGKIGVGIQVNGALYPTWYEK